MAGSIIMRGHSVVKKMSLYPIILSTPKTETDYDGYCASIIIINNTDDIPTHIFLITEGFTPAELIHLHIFAPTPFQQLKPHLLRLMFYINGH